MRSGLWARLGDPAQRIVPVFLTFANGDLHKGVELVMSYGAITRYGGIVSPNAIDSRLSELQDMHWLERTLTKRSSVIHETGRYWITPYSDELMELANAWFLQQRKEIEAKSELRRQQRQCRRSELSSSSVWNRQPEMKAHEDRFTQEGAASVGT